MQTLEQSLSELVISGLVDYDEAVLHTLFPGEIQRATRLAEVEARTA
jgi:hypothetical protein